MSKTVIAFFPDANSAEAVVKKLLDAGHSRNDVKVFSDTASGEGPAGGSRDATTGSLGSQGGASALGHSHFALRNAPIMVSVAVAKDRADDVAQRLRDLGGRDVQIREANWNETASGGAAGGAGGSGVLGAEPPKQK